MYVASVTLRVQAHKQAEVISALEELMRHTRRAHGCLACRLSADTEHPTMFRFVSEWDERNSLDAFLTSREFAILLGMRILLRDDPVILVDDIRARTNLSPPLTHAMV
jgi:quinol monooxygenase YgiN